MGDAELDHRNFKVQIDHLYTIANVKLAALHDALAPGAQSLIDVSDVTRGVPSQVRAADVSYDCLAYDLGARQQRACDVVNAVAEALRQVADVYKKADGDRS